jgi:hypothetical protein
MTPLLLVAALALGQPMPKEVNLVVAPAALPRNSLRLALLPPLLDQQPGDCLALVAEARAAYRALDNFKQVDDEIREDQTAKLADVDRPRLKANLERAGKPLALLERAARASRCDWGKVTNDLRTKGIGASLEVVQEFRSLIPLLAARARLEVLEDRPTDAVRTVGLGLRLAQRVGEAPALISHLVAIALSTILLEQLDVAIAHPKCPNLYWSLTQLPQPLFSLRTAMQGERTGAYGTFPALFRFVLDPNGPLPTEGEMQAFAKTGAGALQNIGIQSGEAERLALGVAISFKHEAAVKYLTETGYPAEKLRQWPPLLVAVVHALVDYEEKLGRTVVAMEQPYWLGVQQLDALEKELRPRGLALDPAGPAIPLSRLLLPAVSRVTMASARNERRFACLRAVEALRLHASSKGGWPKTLAEVEGVPVPVDPVTGEAFDYRVEGDVAVLHGPLVTGKEGGYFELYCTRSGNHSGDADAQTGAAR